MIRARFTACLLAGAITCALVTPAAAIQPAGVASTPTVSVFVEPSAGDGPVLSMLKSARTSIRLEVYELTDSDILTALASAKRRGVSVRVLLEQHPFGGGTYAKRAYAELLQDHIAVKWAHESAFTYTHEKAVDVDNRVAGIFTFNLSYSAFYPTASSE